MTSPSGSGAVVTKKSLSALTSCPKEEVSVSWRVDNFLTEVAVARKKKDNVIARLSFFVGGCDVEQGMASSLGIPRMPLICTMEFWSKETIELNLWVDKLRACDSKIPRELWTVFEVEVQKENQTLRFVDGEGPIKLDEGRSTRLAQPFSSVRAFVDANGSLTFLLKVTTHAMVADKQKNLVVAVEVNRNDLVELDRKCVQGVVSCVGSLLGDEKTSDVKICVVEGTKEIGTFFCHTAILSARSAVFRAMFEKDEMREKREGVVTVEDVSVEVMDQFLTFVYSGRLKEKRKEVAVDPVWVKMLPQLVYLADKYDVGDLKEFCDVQFHRAVTTDNALEMFKVAKRHGLVKAAAKLRDEYVDVLLVLLDSIGK